MTGRELIVLLASCAGLVLGACAQGTDDPADDAASDGIVIDRSISAADIDPDIYFRTDDATDPFRDVYAQFRARRASDMTDPDKPEPIAPYEGMQGGHDLPWSNLRAVFPFEWIEVDAASPGGFAQLDASVKARLVLDHPDLKITQLMLGPGAVLPAHAEGAPGLFVVIGGAGTIMVEGQTQTATPGTNVKLNPYDIRRVTASSDGPLKVLWLRWAPEGDARYMAAGYYLTGANQHIQPKDSALPEDYQYWGETYKSGALLEVIQPITEGADDPFYAEQAATLQAARTALQDKRDPYPDVPVFQHESDKGWLDRETLENANFFWAKDIRELGGLLDRWGEVMRYKGIFQASLPGGGWDFNISQMAWGPHARYVEHSHSIPEFYYIMSGPVEHWIEDTKHVAMPGDVFVTNSYTPHQSRGIMDGEVFRNISGSWAPGGDRSVFNRPFYLLEPLPLQAAGASLGDDPAFH